MDVKENVQLRSHLMWQNGASNCLAETPGEGVGLSRLYGSGSVDRSGTNVSYADVSNREQHLASSSERDPLTSRSKRDPQSPKVTESREIPRKFLRSRPLSDAEMDRKRIIANAQERRLMQRLNNALDRLKRSIPSHLYVPSKRLSKIKTLKLAIEYIAYLNDSLQLFPSPLCYRRTRKPRESEVGDLSLYCAEMVHCQDQSPYFLVSCQLE